MAAGEQDRLIIGRVRRAHGRAGWLRVEILTDFPDRFAPGAQIELGGRRHKVKSRRPAPPDVLLELEGLTPAEADGLHGAYLAVPLAEATPLPPGRYYHYQLVGLAVWDVSGRYHGRIVDVLGYPGQDVFRALDGTREVLIPATHATVREISLPEGRMLVDLPDPVEVSG